MIETLRPRASRPRPTVARLMMRVLVAAILLAAAVGLIRQWPFRGWLGGTVNLGIVCTLLYLPVLPALLIWQRSLSRRRPETNRRAWILLVLGYMGWLGVVFLTFRAALRPLGL